MASIQPLTGLRTSSRTASPNLRLLDLSPSFAKVSLSPAATSSVPYHAAPEHHLLDNIPVTFDEDSNDAITLDGGLSIARKTTDVERKQKAPWKCNRKQKQEKGINYTISSDHTADSRLLEKARCLAVLEKKAHVPVSQIPKNLRSSMHHRPVYSAFEDERTLISESYRRPDKHLYLYSDSYEGNKPNSTNATLDAILAAPELKKVLRCPEPSCDASFIGPYRRGNLVRHCRFHDRRFKQYTCQHPNCTKTFHRSDTRLKHYRKAHPDLVPKPITRSSRAAGTSSTAATGQAIFPTEPSEPSVYQDGAKVPKDSAAVMISEVTYP